MKTNLMSKARPLLFIVSGLLWISSTTVQAIEPTPQNQTVTRLANASVAQMTSTNITLGATDPDTSINSLTFTRVTGSGPFNGTLTTVAGTNGRIRTYTPNAGFAGTDSFRFTVNDGGGVPNPQPQGTVTIRVRPGIFISDNNNIPEGNNFLNCLTSQAGFNIGLTVPLPSGTVTVNWATQNATGNTPVPATAGTNSPCLFSGADYVPASGTVTFAPGDTLESAFVDIWSDLNHEETEIFFVNLSGASANAEIVRGRAVGAIIDNDLGIAEGVPADAIAEVGEPVTYGVQWTVPDPENWHSLNTIDVRLVDDREEILRLRWDDAANTFSLFNPGNETFSQSATPGDRGQFQGSAVTLSLLESDVVGSGPTGPSVTLNLNLSFKPQAAGRTFTVEASATDDTGGEQGYETVGTITVEPH
ncbi:MAG: cadherin-like domain-containing protein [Planctomycetes bacterium]|nr:cadherin-like domain-containing protein [Planctomycetota bacterium]MBI3834537.1 cadherin-like domain-containing protein [Planctomycetota bacterium]